MISRLPKKRASSEKAPGPRQTTAMAITAKRADEASLPKKFSECGCLQNKASPDKAATAPAAGVR